MTTVEVHSRFEAKQPYRSDICRDEIYTDGTILFSHGFELAQWVGNVIVTRTGPVPHQVIRNYCYVGEGRSKALRETPRDEKRMNL